MNFLRILIQHIRLTISLSILLSFTSLSSLAQNEDSSLLVKKGYLEFLMGKLAENNTLKERIVLKDTVISELNIRLGSKENIIRSYKTDSISNAEQKTNLKSQLALSLEEKKLIKQNYTKTRIQNMFLKVGLVSLGALSAILVVKDIKD